MIAAAQSYPHPITFDPSRFASTSYAACFTRTDAGSAMSHSHPASFAARSPSGSVAGSDPPVGLPEQVFSSPNERIYPASTMAAVEATRARFFSRQASGSRTAPRSRPTPTGSVSLSSSSSEPRGPRRGPKEHALSSSSYRQSFFERCQRAMNQSRTSHRDAQLRTLRPGIDGATPGLFSDDMDQDDDSAPSSPPHPEVEGEREEDEELTRARILAEYARLKRIYELKGHLEIGWIDPDQLEWLEHEVGHTDQPLIDPYEGADDHQLEQLWLESQTPSAAPPHHHVNMHDDDAWDDPAFEHALAQLNY